MAFDLSKLNAAVEAGIVDQTKIKTGGFDRRVPAPGIGYARFVSYIEMGKQKRAPYLGKPKSDALEVRLQFELLTPAFPKADPPHPGHTQTIKTDDGEKVIADIIDVRLIISGSDKSGFQKLFKAMRRGRDIKHMAQMLGEAFLVTVYNVESTKTPGKVYANIQSDGVWALQSPMVNNPATGETIKLAIPAPTREIKGFLFDLPSIEDWDSLKIDGEREVEVDGVKVMRSNNFIQNRILGATNFEGSKLATLLDSKGIDFKAMMNESVIDDGVEHEDEGEDDKKPVGKVEEPKVEEPPTVNPADEPAGDDDQAAAMAALGLA